MEKEYNLIVNAQGEKEVVKYTPEKYAESLKNPNFERHLFIPDIHIPDQDKKALAMVLDFIPEFKPDKIHLLGDVIDFTTASQFLILEDTCPTLGQEVRDTRAFFYDFMQAVGKLPKKPEIFYYEGNHEQRLQKFLAKTGHILTDITNEDGTMTLSVEGLFGLKEKGITYVPAYEMHKEGGFIIEHGKLVRCKAGYTASAQVEKYGQSGASGHTHRLAMVSRNFGGDIKMWMECGTLCNLEPTPHYVKKPDWSTGFGVAIYNLKDKLVYPMVIPIQNNTFWFAEKLYRNQ